MKTINELNGTVEMLSGRVHELAEELRASNRELRRRTNTLRYVLIGMGVLLVVAIVAAASVLLDNRQQIEANNRKFCPLIEPFVVRPGDPPSTTPRGRQIAASFDKLAGDFQCR